MLPAVYTDIINVTRRVPYDTAPRDSLNNPVYGDPADWTIVYSNIKVRLAFTGKPLQFMATGELIQPAGVLYYDKTYVILPMDRIITVNVPGSIPGIEYVVNNVSPLFRIHGVVDHMQGSVLLPV